MDVVSSLVKEGGDVSPVVDFGAAGEGFDVAVKGARKVGGDSAGAFAKVFGDRGGAVAAEEAA